MQPYSVHLERPFFFVSTTPAAKDIRSGMGTPAYSYYFAVEALAPVLDRIGRWQLVDRPESRLPYLAKKARSEGFDPIHLAVNPLQDCYFCSSLPNVVLPFWEFPDLPDRDFDDDTRQNWVRVSRGATLVLAPCTFTADAFRRAGVNCPIAVVPVPVAEDAFALPEWKQSHTWTLTCRHEVFGGEPAEAVAIESAKHEFKPATVRHRGFLAARGAFRAISPWIGPENVDRIGSLRRRWKAHAGSSPSKGSLSGLRGAYRRYVRPWLSDRAVEQVTALKEAAFLRLGKARTEPIDPLLPSASVTLGDGLVYLSIFNVGDPRKNWADLLSAFLLSFRDRSDVTLVVKLVTSPRCEHHEAGIFREKVRSMGISHRCRIVLITEFLSDEQMTELFRVTTCYVNTSHAEGACLPLMRALAGGRPSIAPIHSAMADYMDETCGFVVGSHPEPACWPHDPEKRLTTMRHRLVWSDLRDAFLASAAVAEHEPRQYADLARSAKRRLMNYAHLDVTEAALREAIAGL